VKLSRVAFDRRTNCRGVVANHLVRQVTGFRAFDKDAYRSEDDLFDAAMYSVLVSLGDGTEARWSRLKRTPALPRCTVRRRAGRMSFSSLTSTPFFITAVFSPTSRRG
jgi:hypothetical protein